MRNFFPCTVAARDRVAREHVTASGIKKAGFIPCLNQSDGFVDELATKVRKAIAKTPTESI